MGLFSKKTDDTKARIEELKKKIQAEQQAYAAQASTPSTPPAAPAPAATPAPAPQPVMAQPQQIIIEERAPVQMVQPSFSQSSPSHNHNQNASMQQRHGGNDPRMRELGLQQQYDRQPRPVHQEMHLDANAGIVLDLGEGMSLNVPVKTRMRLDDFLALADKVRELQSLQQRPAFH